MKPLVLAVLLGLSPAAARAQYTTLDRIQQRGVITFGVDPNNLPFSSSTNQPPGFDIEIAHRIAAGLGVQFKPVWVRSQHPSFPSQLLKKKCDALIGIAPESFADAKGITFTRPYFGSGFILAVRRGGHSDRTGPVGVEPGVVLTKTRLSNPREYPSQAAILTAIAQGEIAAGYVGAVHAGWLLKNHPEWPVELAKEAPQDHWNIVIAVRKQDVELKAALDKVIQQMLDHNEIASILQQYGIPFYPPF